MQTLRQDSTEREAFFLALEAVVLASMAICLVLLLATPLILSARTIFPFIVGKALASRSLIEFLFGLWVVLAVFRPQYRPRRSKVLIAFAVWLAVSLVAGFAGVSVQRSLWSTYERMQGVIDLAHWFALAVVLAWTLRPGLGRLDFLPGGPSKGGRGRRAKKSTLSEYAVTALRGLLNWRAVLNINLAVALFIALMGLDLYYDVGLVPTYAVLSEGQRLAATLGNPTYLGGYMLVNVLVALAFLGNAIAADREPISQTVSARRRRRRRGEQRSNQDPMRVWWQVFWTLVVVFTLWALLLSGTRGSIFIGLPAAMVFLCAGYLLWGRVRAVKIASVLVLGGMVLLGVVVLGVRSTEAFKDLADSNIILSRIENINLDDPSIKGRLASHKAGLQGFLARPLLGWGPENYAVAFGRYFEFDPEIRETYDQAHNKVLEEMTTKGVLGLISYVALWTVMFAVLYRRFRNCDDREQIFLLFIGAALTGYFLQNLFLFDTSATILQFALMVGFVAGLERTLVVPTDGEAAEMDADLPQRAPSFRAPAVHVPGSVLSALAIIGVSALVALGIVINTRIYYASKVVVRTQVSDITWEQRIGLFQTSIDTFRPLANYPRIFLIGQVGNNFQGMSDEDFALTMDMVDREAIHATDSEPEEWKIHADLALLYYRVASRDQKYQQQADSYLESASELGPETLEVRALKAVTDSD